MASSFVLRICIPNKICVDVNVTQAAFNSLLGQTGILPNHAPIVGAVAPGYVTYKFTDGSNHIGLLNHGVYTFKDNKLTILSDFFEHSCHGVDENAIVTIQNRIVDESKKLELSQKAINSLNSFMQLVSAKAKDANKRK